MKGILVLLILVSLFIFGSVAPQFKTCTVGAAPAQSLPIYGGVVYEKTGTQTYIAISQYLVYPPDSGYYSPEGSGVIYIAGVS
jgi:hypothetical protein